MRDDDGPRGGPRDDEPTDRREEDTADEPPADHHDTDDGADPDRTVTPPAEAPRGEAPDEGNSDHGTHRPDSERRSGGLEPRSDDRGPAPDANPPPRDGGQGGGWKLYLLDVASSVGIVVVIGALLFAASGIWPPMVAVESPSMEPVLERGDLVYLMEADRFPGDGAQGDTGVVTAEVGRENGYRTFDGYGDVIVFKPGGSDSKTPVIHRAMLWVEEGERWYERANRSFTFNADSCTELDDCPADYAGFITKGDNNANYDQVVGRTGRGKIVKPEWIIGTAEVHVPYLGQIRLNSAGANSTAPASAVAGG